MPINLQKFVLDIQAGAAGSRAYHALIVDMRAKAKTGPLVHDLGVLPAETKNPTDFLDVELRTGASTITARFRRDNLYMIGYLPSTQSQWYEFSNSTNTHLIPGSEFLKNDGHYTKLEKAADAARRDIELGERRTAGAVDCLAKPDAPKTIKTHARSLIVIIETISEAMRSTVACEFIRSKWENSTAGKPTQRIIILENSWDPISKAIMDNQTVTDRTIATAITDGAGTPTLQDCINVTGVLLRGDH
ncbi:uncharacterized protein DFL_007093 [Arthrobotrys flagrans]|uniref:Uncharacterized protein n=1 Tax=Arthrobotrys flagrans TaxID=97331 RepID=A0A436ZV89_ARTFL|nr:hypothetical protein DFL_007093 [Arthrobotrys flagrans]